MRSDTPLAPAATAPRDLRLEGLWQAQSGKDRVYIYVAYGKGNTGAVMLFSKDADKGIASAPDVYRFFVTRTAKNCYLNLYEEGKPGPRFYNFERYRFNWLGRLETQTVNGGDENTDNTPFLQDLKAHKVPFKLEGFGEITIRHARPGQLLDVLETSKDADVYGIKPPGVFRKIGEP